MIESVKEFRERTRNERSNVLKQKKLHGQFFNQIEDVAGEEKWLRLRDGSIKRETESLIVAAQEQAIDETVRHIVCECPMLTQREYQKRHDWVGRKIHWEVCRKTGFDVNEKWYKHEPEKMIFGRYYGILQYKLIMSLRQEDLIW